MEYPNVDNLINARNRMASMQIQLTNCYRGIVRQILDGQAEPEDVLYVMDSLAQDCHNKDLCLMYAKLDRYIAENVADENTEGICS